VVAGYFWGTVNFGGGPLTSAGGPDVFVAKYSAANTHLWSKRFGGSRYDEARGVAVDASGNVVITGYFDTSVDFGGGLRSTAGGLDIFVAKLSGVDGSHIWSKSLGGSGSDVPNAVAVDGNGDVVLAGYFGDLFGGTTNLGGGLLTSAGGEDMFVAKYSGATGAYLWARQGGGSGDDEAAAVAVDGTGNVVVTGHFRNTADFSGRSLTSAGIDDVFVAKYSASGASLWAKSFGDADEQQGSAVGVDRDGNIVLAGNFSGSIDLGGGPLYNLAVGDIFLAKLSASGAPVWSFRFGNAGDANPELAKGLAVDGSGNVVLTGQILPSLNFGSGVLWNLTSTNDVFIAKFSPSGTNLWSKRAGSSGDDEGTGAAIDRNGNVLVVGDFFDAVDFGGGALTNPGNAPVGGSQDSFVVKLAP